MPKRIALVATPVVATARTMSPARRVRRTVRGVVRAAELTWIYARSRYDSRRLAGEFDDVRTFCLFIGYQRSGHSLVGSLIDAHPAAVIAHELNVLEHLRFARFSRAQIYSLLLRNSQRFAQAGRNWTGYSYVVPDQWQGRYRKIQVIGDKKGGGTTSLMATHPELIERLRSTVAVPIRFVHVIRNPYDNISTIAKRRRWNLEDSIDYYFALAEANEVIRRDAGDDAIHDLRYESMIADPEGELRRLCEFLGLEAEPEYLRACAGILFDSPRRTRHDAPWTPELVTTVRQRMSGFPTLDGYGYED